MAVAVTLVVRNVSFHLANFSHLVMNNWSFVLLFVADSSQPSNNWAIYLFNEIGMR
jgi:hypothetical protein